jgi:hypothetical protein
MDDVAGLSLNMAWPALQNMYEEGVSHAKALRRSLFQQLRGNESFWRTLKLRDEVLAHIRWSSRILQVCTHVREGVCMSDWSLHVRQQQKLHHHSTAGSRGAREGQAEWVCSSCSSSSLLL